MSKKSATAPAEDTTTALAPAPEKETALAPVGMDLEADSGSGFEKADASAYAIPFLIILQSNSPQCKRSEGEYIEGAQEGMLFNTVTHQLIDGVKDGVIVVPCYYDRKFIEWKDRDAGGGFAGMYDPTDPIVGTTSKSDPEHPNRDMLPNGNHLVDTRQHYCMVVNADGSHYPVMIAMASTQMKKSKRWMSLMDGIKLPRKDGTGMFTPPMFSHKYKLTTVPESNEKGSWMGWKIEAAGKVESASIYTAAKSFRDSISKGEVKVAQPVQEEAPASGNDEHF